MKMNTNNNVYTIVYAAVMVIIVAFLLAFVASSLRETQENNVKLDTKKQILAALNIEATDVDATYNKVVKDNLLQGTELTEVPATEFCSSYSAEIKAGKFHVFVCTLEDGSVKYVFPVYGAGLWGPIWGYVALNDDKDTVYGVYFNHESETPGLGAEITTAKFQGQFVGKKALNNGEVALTVVKNGAAQGENECDGISGGTITSKGVGTMLLGCLANYKEFLNAK